MSVQRVSLPVPEGPVEHVTAAVHAPTRRTRRKRRSVLLVPGAGGDLDSDGLVALAEILADIGCTVVRANLPYREAGRRAPRADRSVTGYRDVLAAAREAVGDQRPWVLGGRSYGGRVASMLVAAGEESVGLLFYSYPLHPPGKPDEPRVQHWPDVHVPTLFLQGDRDPFCDLEQLRTHIHKLPRRATLHVVEGGDHSLRITRTASPTGQAAPEAQVIAGLRAELTGWLDSLER